MGLELSVDGMLAISPNGHYIVVSTYSFGGNWDYKKVYNISKLDTDGAIITFIKNVPKDVDLEDDMVVPRTFNYKPNGLVIKYSR